jgi:hypothetical protein
MEAIDIKYTREFLAGDTVGLATGPDTSSTYPFCLHSSGEERYPILVLHFQGDA